MSCVWSFWPPGNWSRVGQRICCSNDFYSTIEGEKRSRHKRFSFVERDRENLQKILERKVDLAVRAEKEAKQKLYQVEAEIEARNWEKKNSDIAFREINQEFESQRFQQVDGQIRLRETEMENWN